MNVSRSMAGCQARRGQRRAAGLYVLTLSTSLLLLVAGMTLVSIQRADRQLQQSIVLSDDLQWYARAGIETTLAFMEQKTNWRTWARDHGGNPFYNPSNGTSTDLSMDNGTTVTVRLSDPAAPGGQLTTDDTRPLRLRATARRNNSTGVCCLEAQLKPRAHRALRYSLFTTSTSASAVQLNGTYIYGPIRAHGGIYGSGGSYALDDALVETIVGFPITQSSGLTQQSFTNQAIPAPQPNLTAYSTGDASSRATMLTLPAPSGTPPAIRLNNCNLTPTSNTVPPGITNANGIYWLNSPTYDVYIQNMHLRGTLIITVPTGRSVNFQQGLWIEPGPRYPTLLVSNAVASSPIPPGGSAMAAGSSTAKPPPPGLPTNIGLVLMPTYSFSESAFGMDINGNGSSSDTLYSQVRGVVWTNLTALTINGSGSSSTIFCGSFISTGPINMTMGMLDNDLTLRDTLTPGFVDLGMDLVPGSIQEVTPS